MQTAICSFDSRAEAERAADLLVERGLRRDFLYTKAGPSRPTDSTGTSAGDQRSPGFFQRLFSELFGDEDAATKASHYDDAVARGETVLIVDIADDRELEIVRGVMGTLGGSIDVEGSRGPAAPDGAGREAMPLVAGARETASTSEGSTVLPVVEEELQVGKRTVVSGGVRVVKRIVETPVSEAIRLIEERAVIERRPVDRAATEADFAAFGDGTLEVRERTEEPVVAKAARVVEEVVVGKEVRERDETVSDSVRRTDVEIEPIGSAETAREPGATVGRETSTATRRPTDPRR
jgi:uncharacterized protein (TIGR02271 family)